MEVKKITEEMRQQLREPLSSEAIKPHPTKPYLSSIKAIYVVERLNDVFGVGSWTQKSEVVDNKSSHIVVKSCLTIPEYGVYLESFGGNDNGGENSKNFDLGDAYKGAVTDALTKMCSFLEIGIDVFKGQKDKKNIPAKNTPAEPVTEGQINHAKELLDSELFSPEEIENNLAGIKKLTRTEATQALLKLTHAAGLRRKKKEAA
jgi:hypothetical protein